MLHQLAFRLFLIARINPSAWDAIIPMVPKYSKGTRNILSAQIIKAVASQMRDVVIKKDLNEIGQKLFSAGASQMDYDIDYWYCGTTVPLHFPLPHAQGNEFSFDFSDVELNPQPLPPRQNYYGAVLSILAGSVNDEGIASELQRFADNLMNVQQTQLN